jgi:adenylate cyclase
MNKGIRDGNCMRTFFHIQDQLDELKEKYFNEYGLFPRIKASLHCGKLVRAEIGDIKTQIVFQGDVMNTTSRILDYCYKINSELLASAHLVLRMDIPKIYETKSVGDITLKGKEIAVELFKISEKDLVTIK